MNTRYLDRLRALEHIVGDPIVPTEDAALWIVCRGTSVTAAERFGVSEHMVTYRINVTDARTNVARARRFRVVR